MLLQTVYRLSESADYLSLLFRGFEVECQGMGMNSSEVAVIFRTSIVLGLFCILSGCVSTGNDFPSDLSWIKSEETTQDEVVMVMGKPYAVGHSASTTTWTYGYYRYSLFGNSQFKELKLYWTPNSRIKHYSYNSTFKREVDQAANLKK